MTTESGEVTSTTGEIPAATQPRDYHERVEQAAAEAVREVVGRPDWERSVWNDGHAVLYFDHGNTDHLAVHRQGHKVLAFAIVASAEGFADVGDAIRECPSVLLRSVERMAAEIRRWIATEPETHDRPQNDLRYEGGAS